MLNKTIKPAHLSLGQYKLKTQKNEIYFKP